MLLTGPVLALDSGRAYYIDCNVGLDTADGLSPTTPWKSLVKAAASPLVPGSSVLLKRGCSWTGPLNAGWSGIQGAPITIGAYGEGALPIIQNATADIDATGSWLVIDSVHVRADAPTVDRGCQNQRAGVRYGIRFNKGADHNIVRNSQVTELFTGVRMERGADNEQIVNNTFVDNNMKSDDPTSDSGAVAIDVLGDNNDIGYNHISGSDACSRFFNGRDGSAVSIYGGHDNVVHHNVSSQNHDFIEVGNDRALDNLIVYNSDHSTLKQANFLVVHGQNTKYGPVLGTHADHNTSVLTGDASQSIITVGQVDATNLSLRGNILWDDAKIGADKLAFDEGDNIYWAANGLPDIGYPLAPSSQIADPRLVDPANEDYRLLADSPAIDAVRAMDLGSWGQTDGAGVSVPQGFSPDIGAFEFNPAAPPSPLDSLDPGNPGATDAPGASPGGSGNPAAPPTPVPTPEPPPTGTPGNSGGGGLLLPSVIVVGLASGAVIFFVVRRRPL